MLEPGSPALERAAEAGAELDDDGSLVLLRTVGAGTDGTAGRSRAFVGGRSVPQGLLAELADELVTVHGQADQARLRSPAVQREALDEFVGAAHREVLARLPRRVGASARAWTPSSRSSSTGRGTGRARPSCCGSGWPRWSGSTRSRTRT